MARHYNARQFYARHRDSLGAYLIRMTSSQLTTAVLTLLFCSLGVSSFYQPVMSPQLDALSTAVSNHLGSLLQIDLEAMNNTINSLSPAVASCLTSIESEQEACVQCVNTSCQARVDALQCATFHPTPSYSSCSVKALCEIKGVLNKAEVAVVVIGDAVKKIAENVVGAVKKVAENAIKKIGDGLKDAGNAIKHVANNVASDVKQTANNVAAGVEKAVNEVGNAIVKGAEAVGNVVKDGVDKVKDFFNGLGRKKRQAQTEPECQDFAQDEGACLFYKSTCQSCAYFESGSTELSAEDLIRGVCGQSELDSYLTLSAAISRIDQLIEVAQNFTLLSTKFNPTVWQDNGYADVLFEYGMVIANISLSASKPINPYVPDMAGPVIAQDVFNNELPTAA